MNKMKGIANLLGVELGEEFNIVGKDGTMNPENPFRLDEEKGLLCKWGFYSKNTLYDLLRGKCTVQKLRSATLNEAELLILELLITTSINDICSIKKVLSANSDGIYLTIKSGFEKTEYDDDVTHTMNGELFKALELNKLYTLEELGYNHGG